MIVKNFEYFYGKETNIRKLVIVYKHLQPVYMELENLKGKDKTLLTNTFNDDLLSIDTLGPPSEGVAILCLDDVSHNMEIKILKNAFIGGSFGAKYFYTCRLFYWVHSSFESFNHFVVS